MAEKKFEAGAAYVAFNGAKEVGTFAAHQAEQMSESPIYRGLRWQKIESKTLPIPEGVKAKSKAKDKPEQKTGDSNEGTDKISPADGLV